MLRRAGRRGGRGGSVAGAGLALRGVGGGASAGRGDVPAGRGVRGVGGLSRRAVAAALAGARCWGRDGERARWAAIRDVAAFHGQTGDVWRLSVTPTAAPAVVARAGAEAALYDWGGGLIWLRVAPGTDLRARLGTVRRPCRARACGAGHAGGRAGLPARGRAACRIDGGPAGAVRSAAVFSIPA